MSRAKSSCSIRKGKVPTSCFGDNLICLNCKQTGIVCKFYKTAVTFYFHRISNVYQSYLQLKSPIFQHCFLFLSEISYAEEHISIFFLCCLVFKIDAIHITKTRLYQVSAFDFVLILHVTILIDLKLYSTWADSLRASFLRYRKLGCI